MADELVLTGLEGTNPQGFLAALGTVRVLVERGVDAKLGWRLMDVWQPVLEGRGMDRGAVLDELERDVQAWRAKPPELKLSYEKTSKKGTQTVFELKPSPQQFQEFAAGAREAALSGSRRWADYAASYGAAYRGLGVDNNGNTKPTALHFCAGNQLFLAAVRSLVADVTREDLDEALFGPWRYERTLPVLGWDVIAGEREYALRASDPSREKKTGVPGADWLAFRGMAFFPVVLCKGSATTTGFSGKGKRYDFHWALWEQPITADVLQTVVGTRWDLVSKVERQARGIQLVLKSRVRRTDQGGYGSFAPAGVQ